MFKRGIPLVVCDIETGGLEVTRPIIQLAAVVINTTSFEEIEHFETKLKFNEADCATAALSMNHYNAEAWQAAVEPRTGFSQLAKLFERHKCAARMSKANRPYRVAIAAGYNSGFDSERILYHSRRLDIFQPVDPRFLCVMQLAFWRSLGLESYKLTEIAQHLKLDITGAHDALTDVRLTVKVLQAIYKE